MLTSQRRCSLSQIWTVRREAIQPTDSIPDDDDSDFHGGEKSPRMSSLEIHHSMLIPYQLYRRCSPLHLVKADILSIGSQRSAPRRVRLCLIPSISFSINCPSTSANLLARLVGYPSCRQAAMFLKKTFTQLGASSSLLSGATGKNPLVVATFKGKEPAEGKPKKRVLFYGRS